jgi:Na+-translocating ferredoxin:NAD+ oxidoreductase RnfD subunit
MLKWLDSWLNTITMHRLTLYVLLVTVVSACIFGFLGYLPVSAGGLVAHTALSLGLCWTSNWIFAKLFKAHYKLDSVLITALILVLLIPVNLPSSLVFIALASVLAMAMKYFPTIERRHIFNLAAAAFPALELTTNFTPTWWVGTPLLIPIILIGGLLIARRIRREQMVAIFMLTYFAFLTLGAVLHGSSVVSVWQMSLLHTAVLFFAFIMFTEPATSPILPKARTIYAVVVALCYATVAVRLGGIAFTPEAALVLGNVVAYLMRPKLPKSVTPPLPAVVPSVAQAAVQPVQKTTL